MRERFALALAAMGLAAAVTGGATAATKPTAEEAKAFIEQAEVRLLELGTGSSARPGCRPPTSPTTRRRSPPRPTRT